jgi:DNA-binding MarR family transcriptional regulator
MRHDPRTAQIIELQLARLVRGLEAVRRGRARVAAMDRAVYVLLDRLAAGPRSASELQADLHLEQSTISRQIAALERRGLAGRVAHPGGGRAGRIALTEDGQQALDAERASRADRIDAVLHDWDEQDRRQLARLITRLNDSIDGRIAALAASPPHRGSSVPQH